MGIFSGKKKQFLLLFLVCLVISNSAIAGKHNKFNRRRIRGPRLHLETFLNSLPPPQTDLVAELEQKAPEEDTKNGQPPAQTQKKIHFCVSEPIHSDLESFLERPYLWQSHYSERSHRVHGYVEVVGTERRKKWLDRLGERSKVAKRLNNFLRHSGTNIFRLITKSGTNIVLVFTDEFGLNAIVGPLAPLDVRGDTNDVILAMLTLPLSLYTDSEGMSEDDLSSEEDSVTVEVEPSQEQGIAVDEKHLLFDWGSQI